MRGFTAVIPFVLLSFSPAFAQQLVIKSGFDPVWWTSSERWIRCPDRWQSPPSEGPPFFGSLGE
jgi:hypothetical protein